MIVSAARRHGRASSRRGPYRRGGRNDNQRRADCERAAAHQPVCPYSLAKEGDKLRDAGRDLAAQPFQAEQRVGARRCNLDSLGGEMSAEEIEMRTRLVEL